MNIIIRLFLYVLGLTLVTSSSAYAQTNSIFQGSLIELSLIWIMPLVSIFIFGRLAKK